MRSRRFRSLRPAVVAFGLGTLLFAGADAFGQTLVAPDGLGLLPSPVQPTQNGFDPSSIQLAPPPVVLSPPNSYDARRPQYAQEWVTSPVPVPVNQSPTSFYPADATPMLGSPAFDAAPYDAIPGHLIEPTVVSPMPQHGPSISTWAPVKPKVRSESKRVEVHSDVYQQHGMAPRTPTAARVWKAMPHFR